MASEWGCQRVADALVKTEAELLTLRREIESLVRKWRAMSDAKLESGYYARNDTANALLDCADELEQVSK